MSNDIVKNVVRISVADIKVPEGRYRKDFGDIEILAESIKELGQKVPILINDAMVLIAGERRLRAHKFLGMDFIEAIIEPTTQVNNKVIEIIENLHRKQFDWREQVIAESELHDMLAASNKSWSLRKTSEKTGISLGGLSMDLNIAEVLKDDPELFAKCKTKESAMKTLQKYKIDEIQAEIALRNEEKDDAKQVRKILFKGDAFDLIKRIPDGVIDSVITDPPYGINISLVKKSDEINEENDIYEDSADTYINMMSKLIPELVRVMKPNSHLVFFFAMQHYDFIRGCLVSHGLHVNHVPGIWNRKRGQTMQPNKNLASCYEAFFHGIKGDAQIIKTGHGNVFEYSSPMDKDHPVQKPLGLMEDLVTTFALPGHKILDPFCGSGTTAVACIKNAMQPITFELNDDYYNIAFNRISRAISLKNEGHLDLCE